MDRGKGGDHLAYYTIKGIYRESIPVLIAAAVVGILSGGILINNSEFLLAFPFLLITLPPLIKVGGDMGGILAAKVSSSLHLGLLDGQFFRNRVTINSLYAGFIMGLILLTLLGVSIYILSVSIGMSAEILLILEICLGVGTIQMSAIFTLTLVLAYLSYKYGLDPDNVIIPVITTFGDIVGIIAIVFFMVWIL